MELKCDYCEKRIYNGYLMKGKLRFCDIACATRYEASR